MAYTAKSFIKRKKKKKEEKRKTKRKIISRTFYRAADAVLLFRSFVLGGFCRGCCACVGTVVLLGGADAVLLLRHIYAHFI